MTSPHAALGNARMLMTLLRTPKLRERLAALLADPSRADLTPPLDRLGWLTPDGTVDPEALSSIIAGLTEFAGDRAILLHSPLRELPVGEDQTAELARSLVTLVFDRLGSPLSVSEAQLNAGLAMLVADVPRIRRSAVDAGVLTRTPDGARYRLATTG